MIDARKTFRKVNQKINDFSPDHLDGLKKIISFYRNEKVSFDNNKWLEKNFTKKKYEDITGLCKITDIKEIEKNDYSLNPGRYVGFKLTFDENFNFEKRVKEIQNDLDNLQKQNNSLLKEILKL